MEEYGAKLTYDSFLQEETHTSIKLDAIPICCCLWDKEFQMADCNLETLHLFGISKKQEFMDGFFSFSPEYQPDGRLSCEKFLERIKIASCLERTKFEWMHQNLNGELIPAEITLVRMIHEDSFFILGFVRDLKELKAAAAMLGQLEKLAFVDALTDCYNRRYFMETARKEFSNFEFSQKPMAIIMMDIDKFKHVNDTYGHSFGDEVLKQLAAKIRKVLRPCDLFARYGGEEFIILMMDADMELAVRLAWRIRDLVKNTKIIHEGRTVVNTVSLGVADKIIGSQTLEEVIQRADRALYKAKNNGRDTVESDG